MLFADNETAERIGGGPDMGGKTANVSLFINEFSEAAAIYDEENDDVKFFWGTVDLSLTCPADCDGAALFLCGSLPKLGEGPEASPIGELADFGNGGFEICIFEAERSIRPTPLRGEGVWAFCAPTGAALRFRG